MSEGGGPPDSAAYLRARLDVVEQRVRRALALRRESDPGADADADAAGSYPSWQIERGLAAAEAVGLAAEAAGVRVRLRSLARAFALTELDTELLLVALAPEVDRRFGLFYGYRHDDAQRRHASVGLALELCGTSSSHPAHRARLAPGAPLLAGGLLAVADEDQPFPARTLRVDERVTGHLLGADRIDPLLAGLATFLSSPRLPAGSRARAAADRLVASLASGWAEGLLLYLRGSADSAVMDVAAAAARPGSTDPRAGRHDAA